MLRSKKRKKFTSRTRLNTAEERVIIKRMMEILDPKNCTQMMAMFNKKKSPINLPNPLITEISMG